MVDSGLRIREIRESRRESGISISQILGISPQYYYDLEKGQRNLSTEIAAKLANHFSVSVDYLLGRSNEVKVEDIELALIKKLATYDNLDQVMVLIDILKDATKEDIEKSIKIIEAITEK